MKKISKHSRRYSNLKMRFHSMMKKMLLPIVKMMNQILSVLIRLLS